MVGDARRPRHHVNRGASSGLPRIDLQRGLAQIKPSPWKLRRPSWAENALGPPVLPPNRNDCRWRTTLPRWPTDSRPLAAEQTNF